MKKLFALVLIAFVVLCARGTESWAAFGGSMSFDGVDDYLLASPDPSLDLNDGTIEFWVKRGNTAGNACILANRGPDGQSRFSVHMSGTVIGLYNGAWKSLPFVSTPGQWYHIALVETGTTTQVFVNGSSIGTLAGDFNQDVSEQPFTIGATYGASGVLYEPFTGELDEIRIWNVPRSQAQIQATMGTTLAGAEAGLVAYYRFDEGGGSVADDFAGSHTAALSGAVRAVSTAPINYPPSAGFGKALLFDGSNDYVAVSPIDRSGTNQLSLEAWVQATNVTSLTYREILRQQKSGIPDWLLSFQGNGTILSFGLNTTAGYAELDVPITPASFTDGRWHHIAATYDGTKKRLYVDGVEIGSQGTSGTILFSAATGGLSFGATWNGSTVSEFFAGRIDEVRIWGVARSHQQIQQGMYLPLKGDETGLVGYWPFEERAGLWSFDRSTGERTGELRGGIAWADSLTTIPSTVNDDTNLSLTLEGFDPNNDGSAQTNTLRAVITALPAQGSLHQTSDGITKGAPITTVPTTVSDASNRVIYCPSPNATAVASFSYRTNDGSSDSADAVTHSIVVTPVNDSPTSADASVTTSENTAYPFSSSSFPFSDVDGDPLHAVRITQLPAAGTLNFNGQTVALNQIIAVQDLSKLTFVPTAGTFGSPYASFGYQVRDAAVFSAVSQSMTINVTAGIFKLTAVPAQNGTISPSGTVSRSHGQSQTYTITPAAGHAIRTVLVNGQPVGSPTSYTFADITADQTISAVFVSNQSTVTGHIYDIAGTPVAGATVSIGGASAMSDTNGSYQLVVPAATQTLAVDKTGFVSFTESFEAVPAAVVTRNYTLQSTGEDIKITIRSKYPGQSYFVSGIEHFVTFTAEVYWGSHPPGTVRFVTPKGTYEVPAQNFNPTTRIASATREFNMGTEFTPCTRLRLVAVAGDGATTPEKLAPFSVMPKPSWLPGFVVYDPPVGNAFEYRGIPGPMEFFTAMIPRDAISSQVPLFSLGDFGLKFSPSLDVRIERNEIGYELAVAGADPLKSSFTDPKTWAAAQAEMKSKIKQRLAGAEFDIVPSLTLEGQFEEESCSWDTGGYLGATGSVSASVTWPMMIGPYPAFFKTSTDSSLSLHLGISSFNPSPQFNGIVGINPYVRGTIGAGIDRVAALEGWVGGATSEFQWPATPTVSRLDLYLNAGATAYVWIWRYEYQGMRWVWSLANNSSSAVRAFTGGPLEAFSPPALIRRDYLVRPDYATFDGGAIPRARAQSLGDTNLGVLTLIQSTVYPRSQSVLSADGSSLNLAWLFDDPARSDINRTELVWSARNSSVWSAPVSIADDGTADFNPYLLTLADGTIMAVWEDQKTALADGALFDDMTAGMEISAALFNPQTQTWGAEMPITGNAFLDRSPQLAGVSKNDLLLVWIANPQNNIRGNAASPNSVMASRWNGSAWSAPETVAVVPNYIVKYDLVYDGTDAHLVLALDTDNDATTVVDHELYRYDFSAGAWGQEVRLTFDGFADDNPQLAFDPNGDVVLAWLKGNEVSSVTNFIFSERTVIRSDEYSSSLADFKLASNTAGKIALLWTEPTEFDSDIHTLFYDPILDVWGEPKKLTSDAQIEQTLTAAFVDNSLFSVFNRSHDGGTTDLYLLEYQIHGDLRIAANGLAMSPANPLPGTPVTLVALLENAGDTAAQDVAVSFYSGPAGSGDLIGRIVAEGILAPGEFRSVSLDWTVPADATTLSVSALVDPDQSSEDSNRLNNVLTASFLKPDLTVTYTRWEKIGNGFYVTFEILNQGSLASGSTYWTISNQEGNILLTGTVPPLNPWEATSLTAGPLPDTELVSSNLSFVVGVDEGDPGAGILIDEYDEANNSKRLTIDRLIAGLCDPVKYYPDADGDGYGEAGGVFMEVCTAPQGTGAYASNSLDWNDGDFTVFPGADEVCDGIDNDQDGQIDEAPECQPSPSGEPARVPVTEGWWALLAALSGLALLRRKRA